MATVTRPSTPLPDPGDEMDAEQVRDWINNILTFLESTNIDEANVDLTSLDGIMGKSTAQTIVGKKTFESTNAAAAGIVEVLELGLNPASGTAADNDGGRVVLYADDDGGNATDLVNLDWVLTDASNGSEDAEFRIRALKAGTMTNFITAGSTSAGTGRVAITGDLAVSEAGTFGGGYGATGVTIATTGVIQANGAITSDGAVTGATLAGTISTAAQNSITSASSLATVGTITSGTWSGVIDGSATMTLGSDATGDIYYRDASGFLERLASGADGTVLTGTGAGAIPAWESPTTGDITSVVAGVGLSGGGTTGDVTLTLDISELSTVTPADGDFFATLDSDGANEQKTTTTALATLFAGAGMTATSAVLNVIGGDGITANSNDVAITAAQTTVTSVYNASLKMGRDSQNLIDFATTDNKIILRVNNVDEVELVADTLQPTTSDGVALGTASLMWSDLFLASGSVVNFAAGDVTLTHSSETLTVAGGTLAAAAITGTTIDATTNFTIGDTVITDGVITDTSGLSVASATNVASTLTVGANTDGHDVKFFGDATGSYMEWDESEEQLRILGPATDAAASSGKLLLATAQVAVASGDILGQIDFQAPLETQTGDAREISASIRAMAQDTFTATVNKTDLIFYTGSSEAATEKFRFTSDGELGVGGANYGTDGQVLTSAGAGAAAAWEDAAGFSSGDAHTWTADQTFNDNVKVTLGTGGDADIYFDGTDLRIKPGLVTATNTLKVTAGDNIGMEIQGSTASTLLQIASASEAQNNSNGIYFQAAKDVAAGSANSTGALSSTTTNDGGTLTGDLRFFTNSGDSLGERMRITSAGKVGIGNTTPSTYANGNAALVVGVGGTSGSAVSEITIASDDAGVGELNYTDTADTTNQCSASYNHSTAIWQLANGGNALSIVQGGKLIVQDNANTFMTIGLTLNQAENDNEILAFKSSDVAHGMTSITETDTYGMFRKHTGLGGGLEIMGLADTAADAGGAILITAILGEAADTTKTTNARAIAEISAKIKSGTGSGDAGTDANLLSIRTGSALARFIFDQEGTAHADVAWTTFDEHDDIALLHDIEATMVPDIFGKAMKYDQAYLQKLGIIGEGSIRKEGGKTRGMINTTKLQMLHHGAIRQVHQQLQETKEFYQDKIAALESRLMRLEN